MKPPPEPEGCAYEFTVPIRVINPANRSATNGFARGRRRKAEREATHFAFVSARNTARQPPEPPYLVTLTRFGPGGRMDEHDGLRLACKSVVDQICVGLGVDDRQTELIRFAYRQEYAKGHSVRVRIETRRDDG